MKLLQLAPHHRNLSDARHREQGRPNGPVREGPQIHRRHTLACHAHQHDLPHDRADGRHERRDPLGQALDRLIDPLLDDLAVEADIRIPVELDEDDRQSDPRDAPHSLDARSAVHHRLDGVRYLDFDLFRRESRRFDQDRDCRSVEVRQHIDGETKSGHHPVHTDRQRSQDDEHAVRERESDNGLEHGWTFRERCDQPASSVGRPAESFSAAASAKVSTFGRSCVRL